MAMASSMRPTTRLASWTSGSLAGGEFFEEELLRQRRAGEVLAEAVMDIQADAALLALADDEDFLFEALALDQLRGELRRCARGHARSRVSWMMAQAAEQPTTMR